MTIFFNRIPPINPFITLHFVIFLCSLFSVSFSFFWCFLVISASVQESMKVNNIYNQLLLIGKNMFFLIFFTFLQLFFIEGITHEFFIKPLEIHYFLSSLLIVFSIFVQKKKDVDYHRETFSLRPYGNRCQKTDKKSVFVIF